MFNSRLNQQQLHLQSSTACTAPGCCQPWCQPGPRPARMGAVASATRWHRARAGDPTADIHRQHKDKQLFGKAESLWSGLWCPFPHLLRRGHSREELRGHQGRNQLSHSLALTPLTIPHSESMECPSHKPPGAHVNFSPQVDGSSFAHIKYIVVFCDAPEPADIPCPWTGCWQRGL